MSNTINSISGNLNTPAQSPSYLAYLDNLIKTSDMIILDADTAQKGAAYDALVRQFIPFLAKHKRQIICPQATLSELKFLSASVDQRVAGKATKALEGIHALFHAGFIVFRGDPNKSETADAAIIRMVATNIWDTNILVLTQSGDVAADCKLFNQIRSTKINHTVTVKRISDQFGKLQDFFESHNSLDQISEKKTTANTADVLKRFGL
ncbi:MAG: hypothetical protein E7665_07185 [Ruminococcaceae bacterium]|nr:hypothetical protein [Oscillospiraceae bacterium]